MKKLGLYLLTLALLLSAAGCRQDRGWVLDNPDKNPIVTITMDDGEQINLMLYPGKAPNTVNNFISLVQQKFYDGLTFHRVIDGFMIQGGDPEGDGRGGPGYMIAGEFSGNGFESNDLKHTKGILSMARSEVMDSAGSQFFIMTGDAPHLDGQYAAFGQVMDQKSLDEVLKLSKLPTEGTPTDKPNKPPVMKTVTVNTYGKKYDEPQKAGETVSNKHTKNPIVTFTMDDGSVIKAELYPDKAPNTVDNFVSLVQKGFYNGVIFHRIIPGFVLQGGDPKGTGMGGPGYSIKGEFSANGFAQNDLKHTVGVLSMARSQSMDSAGSQFFIMVGDASSLDGKYAAFGKVTDEDSLAVCMRLAKTPTGAGDRPTTPPVIKTVTVDTFGETYDAPQTLK